MDSIYFVFWQSDLYPVRAIFICCYASHQDIPIINPYRGIFLCHASGNKRIGARFGWHNQGQFINIQFCLPNAIDIIFSIYTIACRSIELNGRHRNCTQNFYAISDYCVFAFYRDAQHIVFGRYGRFFPIYGQAILYIPCSCRQS